MTKAFFVSYTDPVSKKVIVNLHVGTEIKFSVDGLQMVSQEIDVDNVFVKI